jgi:hypothetical protein
MIPIKSILVETKIPQSNTKPTAKGNGVLTQSLSPKQSNGTTLLQLTANL